MVKKVKHLQFFKKSLKFTLTRLILARAEAKWSSQTDEAAPTEQDVRAAAPSGCSSHSRSEIEYEQKWLKFKKVRVISILKVERRLFKTWEFCFVPNGRSWPWNIQRKWFLTTLDFWYVAFSKLLVSTKLTGEFDRCTRGFSRLWIGIEDTNVARRLRLVRLPRLKILVTMSIIFKTI